MISPHYAKMTVGLIDGVAQFLDWLAKRPSVIVDLLTQEWETIGELDYAFDMTPKEKEQMRRDREDTTAMLPTCRVTGDAWARISMFKPAGFKGWSDWVYNLSVQAHCRGGNMQQEFWGLQYPISHQKGGGNYYVPRDPSYGLELPLWTSEFLTVYPENRSRPDRSAPWQRMRHNPRRLRGVMHMSVRQWIAMREFFGWLSTTRGGPGFVEDDATVSFADPASRGRDIDVYFDLDQSAGPSLAFRMAPRGRPGGAAVYVSKNGIEFEAHNVAATKLRP